MELPQLSMPRRTAAFAFTSVLIAAGMTWLVIAHPLTDEGDDGIRLLGSHAADRPGTPGGPNDRTSRGWAHGDKDGWKGRDVPPGWSHGDKDGWKGRELPPGWAKHDAPGLMHGPDKDARHPGDDDKGDRDDRDEQGKQRHR